MEGSSRRALVHGRQFLAGITDSALDRTPLVDRRLDAGVQGTRLE